MIFLFLLSSLLHFSQANASNLSLPGEMKALMNKKLSAHGPNCWGTALYLKGISPVPRFVSSAEISYWQETPLCRPLELHEAIEPGDILNVYGPEFTFTSDLSLTDAQKFINLFEKGRYQEATDLRYSGFHRLLHSETFMNSSQVFGKESPNKNDPFKITKLQEVYGRPRSERECQESPILTPHLREFNNEPRSIRDSKCGYFSKVYRCENFDEFFQLPPDDKRIMSQIGLFQKRIFEAVKSSSRRLSLKEKENIQRYAQSVISDILLQINPEMDTDSRMLLSWKYFQAYSLIESIKWIEDV